MERDDLIRATEAAIGAVGHPRLFDTERWFQGEFHHALRTQLDQMGICPAGSILELEYQKSRRHGLRQRPDIILHVPAEHSIFVRENNYAVWALKYKASVRKARKDFVLLDEMFSELDYPLGFFVNIGSLDSMVQHYAGRYRDRLLGVGVTHEHGETLIRCSAA